MQVLDKAGTRQRWMKYVQVHSPNDNFAMFEMRRIFASQWVHKWRTEPQRLDNISRQHNNLSVTANNS